MHCQQDVKGRIFLGYKMLRGGGKSNQLRGNFNSEI